MSLISERVGYLLKSYSAQEIAEITGLPLESMYPELTSIEPVDPNIRRNTYNLYGRTVYQDLRAEGAGTAEARRYRSKAVSVVEARLGQRGELINDLANLRLGQYRQYLISQGKYTSDDDTLATLKESIARQMGRSKLPPSQYNYDSYPTLDFGVLDDNF